MSVYHSNFSLLVERVFLFMRVIKFLVTLDLHLTLKNDFLNLNLTFIYFNSKR